MGEDTKVYEKCSIKCPEEELPQKYGYGIRHVQMLCMCICITTLFIARSCLGVAILAMTDQTRLNDTRVEIYDWDKKTQGLILSSFFWGYMAMQIPAGLLAKKYGGKLILLVALLVSGFVCVILPVATKFGGWPVVCVCRVAMGLTQACLFPATHTLLGRWLPASERTAMSGIVYSGSQIGTIISMPVSGVLSETALGWKMIFYSISCLMFVFSIVWYFFAASSPAEHRLISAKEREYIERELNTKPATKDRPVPWRHILTTIPLYAIMVSHIGSALAFTLFFVDLPTYLERAMEISLKDSAMLSALPYTGMLIGCILSTYISEMIYNKGILHLSTCRKVFNSIALFCTSGGLVFLSFLHPDHKNVAVCVLILALTTYGFISAGFMVNHLDLSPHFAGVMLSLTNFVAGISGIGTPVLTSFILGNDPSDVSRWRIVFLMTAAILVSCNIVYLCFASSTRQAWDIEDDKQNAELEELNPVLSKSQEKDQEANKQLHQ